MFHAHFQHVFLCYAITALRRLPARSVGTDKEDGADFDDQLVQIVACGHGVQLYIYRSAIQEYICWVHCDWVADLSQFLEQEG